MEKCIKEYVEQYLNARLLQRKLDEKTIRAYRIDLLQFIEELGPVCLPEVSSEQIEAYAVKLHGKYKPKTVKRKIASVSGFFRYLERKREIPVNPMYNAEIQFKPPALLPKTVPLYSLECILKKMYGQKLEGRTPYRRRNAVRDIAVLELLFATGIRISELCGLNSSDVDLRDGVVLIYGKGDKQRRLQITNASVLQALRDYSEEFHKEIETCGVFFVNQSGRAFSDQCVRRMLRIYTGMCEPGLRITPHMVRHTFASSLLEADVDIRIIQELLGHTSISTTQIYTHVAMSKQRNVLSLKHPRNSFHV